MIPGALIRKWPIEHGSLPLQIKAASFVFKRKWENIVVLLYVYTILDHEWKERGKKKNETGYKQVEEKEGKGKRVESLQLRVCCKLVLWFWELGRGSAWTNLALLADFGAVHLLSESRRFLFTYNISLIKVLLSHCHVHFGNLQWICVIKSRGHLFNSFFFLPHESVKSHLISIYSMLVSWSTMWTPLKHVNF